MLCVLKVSNLCIYILGLFSWRITGWLRAWVSFAANSACCANREPISTRMCPQKKKHLKFVRVWNSHHWKHGTYWAKNLLTIYTGIGGANFLDAIESRMFFLVDYFPCLSCPAQVCRPQARSLKVCLASGAMLGKSGPTSWRRKGVLLTSFFWKVIICVGWWYITSFPRYIPSNNFKNS